MEYEIMPSHIEIRDETNEDIAAIAALTIAAFQDLEVSNQTEHFIIDALRAAAALSLSLVAVVDGRVVGHIAFSPVTLSDGIGSDGIGSDGIGDWYGLGPVSVLPPMQRRGIGTALVREGLSRLERRQARGCCLVGHPAYYRRFGFENCPSLVLEGVPPEVFFALSFDGTIPRGTVAFHEGFGAVGPSPRAGEV